MAELLLLNGPNLNLLGDREPDHYGRVTLADIERHLCGIAEGAGHHLRCVQSNAEHELIDHAQRARREHVAFILVNPAGLTHTSVALRDALSATEIPFIEIHLSNIYAREPFRRRSYFSDLAVGVISGLGAHGYELALTAAINRIQNR
ncbi:MAG: type II 3-dehydroquinate dehydratase [Acidiferrobacteraceae bacterium]